MALIQDLQQETLKGSSSTAQGVSPGIRVVQGASPERAALAASPFRANSLGLHNPGLALWALLLHPIGIQAPDSRGLEIVPVFLN